MNRLIPVIAAAAVAVAGGAYWMSSTQTATNTTAVTTLPAVSNVQQVSSEGAEASEIVEMVMGSDDAPITIIEYASFTCPHCATFHESVLKPLKADYVDTGKVKFIFRDVYFDRFGLWASMVARCGGQERFFGMADYLMETQSEWTRAGDPVAISDALRKAGRLAGLEDDTLQACLQDEDKAKALVAWFQENAAADDISSTPTLIINGEKHSNMSYKDLREILDAKL
ncbi:DsbA family protein [Shimia marina]|uniref:Thiol-disulfide oxidoreductase D n=1 Tax=Shimia marina TaxID=321267 RepID=A0A0P1EL84_9RHOB|nr:DsbA family protein [Shimia marina]CUH51091.1 Thiol-disulfide oxidoreductase D [Shimia marina]SFD58299.1 Thioredoxin [Shimia marina]